MSGSSPARLTVPRLAFAALLPALQIGAVVTAASDAAWPAAALAVHPVAAVTITPGWEGGACAPRPPRFAPLRNGNWHEPREAAPVWRTVMPAAPVGPGCRTT